MTAVLNHPNILHLTPRPYQDEAVAAILRAEARGVFRTLIALPTGTGKTIVFAKLIQQRYGRALVLAHREELIQQAVDKLRWVDPGMDIGIVKAERDAHYAQVVVASVQTLSRSERLDQLVPDFATIVIDEAHHATAKTYRRILSHFGAWQPDGPLVVGVTATPERADDSSLGHVFQEIVYQRSLLEMIRAKYLSDLRAVQVFLRADFDVLRTRNGDFRDADLHNLLLEANAPDHILGAFQEHAADRKTLIFTPTVQMAYAIAAKFVEAGIAAEALDGKTPLDTRRAILRRFHTGVTQVVVNCAVLTEGFDEPSVNCIIVARPTKSRPLYQQMIGRGTRIYPGKSDCLVLDVVGVSTRHNLQTAATLFGLPPEVLARQTVTEAIADREFEEQRDAVQGTLVSTRVDLFTCRPLRWVQTRKGAWVLSLAQHDIVRLIPDGHDTWQVERVQRDQVPTVLGEKLPLEYAQGVAEDAARELGAESLLQADAPWRQLPASTKQINLLHLFGLTTPLGLTRGEASDLITSQVGDRI